jgi:uncharacterized membrane protein
MGIFGWIRFAITLAVGVGVLVASILAFTDAARVPERAFVTADKRTKKFWLLVLGAGLLFSILGALQMVGIMLNIIAIIPAAAYWYGVRAEVKPQVAAIQRLNTSALRNSFSSRPPKNTVPFSPSDSRAAGNPNDPRFDV